MVLEPLDCQTPYVIKDIEVCKYVSASVLLFFSMEFHLPVPMHNIAYAYFI